MYAACSRLGKSTLLNAVATNATATLGKSALIMALGYEEVLHPLSHSDLGGRFDDLACGWVHAGHMEDDGPKDIQAAAVDRCRLAFDPAEV